MILQSKANVLVLTMLLCGVALAQEPASVVIQSSMLEPAATSSAGFPETPQQHRFWDWENQALFSTVAISSAADFVVTRNNLANGGKELNPLTRLFCGSTPALAANFAGETAGVVGLSYFFHRTRHHKLERATPAVNIAFSAFAVAYSRANR